MTKLVTIIVARKPLDGGVVDNVQKWGCGAINIEGTRIGTGVDRSSGGLGSAKTTFLQPALEKRYERPVGGRWPANLILSHLPGCRFEGTKKVKPMGGSGRAGAGGHGFQDQYVGGEKQRDGFTGGFVDDDGLEEIDSWQCVEGCPADDLGNQSGNVTYGNKDGGYTYPGTQYEVRGFVRKCTPQAPSNYGDQGTASKFFLQIQGDGDDET